MHCTISCSTKAHLQTATENTHLQPHPTSPTVRHPWIVKISRVGINNAKISTSLACLPACLPADAHCGSFGQIIPKHTSNPTHSGRPSPQVSTSSRPNPQTTSRPSKLLQWLPLCNIPYMATGSRDRHVTLPLSPTSSVSVMCTLSRPSNTPAPTYGSTHSQRSQISKFQRPTPESH